MLGAIIGDVIGSVYEWHNVKTTDFPLFQRFTRFTDDTVLTVAVADALLSRTARGSRWLDRRASKRLYAAKLRQYALWYPGAGYGERFEKWARTRGAGPYRSYGNGSAMRVSPIGYAFDSLDEVLRQARWSAAVTHNHRDGVRGAQAVAGAVFLARTGASKAEIRAFVERRCRYSLRRTLEQIRPAYAFDASCAGSVPEALTAFLESDGFEDAIRKAISLGGDSDTIACMAGAVAEAYYGSPPAQLASEVLLKLDYKQQDILRAFQSRFMARGIYE